MKTEIITFFIKTDKDGTVSSTAVGSPGLKAMILGTVLTQAIQNIQVGCAKKMIDNGYRAKSKEADAFMNEILVHDLGDI